MELKLVHFPGLQAVKSASKAPVKPNMPLMFVAFETSHPLKSFPGRREPHSENIRSNLSTFPVLKFSMPCPSNFEQLKNVDLWGGVRGQEVGGVLT
jgi:hypothetical protein